MTIPARSNGEQSVQYLRAPINYTQGQTATVQMGTLPAHSIVLRTYVIVNTAFNNGSTNTMTIGTSGSAAAFGTAIALGTVGVITGGSALATATLMHQTSDTSIVAVHASTGTASTAGDGYAILEYLPVQ